MTPLTLRDICDPSDPSVTPAGLQVTSVTPADLQVTDEQRQHTKAVCYGLIYGMGERSLAGQMSVSAERAAQLQEMFHTQFPGQSVAAARSGGGDSGV